jgi:TolB protein
MRDLALASGSFVAALAAALAAAAPAHATFPGRNGLIAFDTTDAEVSQIRTIAPNGRHLRQLTHGKHRNTDPHWSRDGERIAWVSDQSGSPQIWAMRRDGSHKHAVTHDPAADFQTPAWSPNGRRIVASRCSHLVFTCDIVSLRARDGKGMRVLIAGYWHHQQCSYSPDGRHLAYTSDEGGYDSRLWVADASGHHRRHITAPVLTADGASWSPDGRRLLFTGDRHKGFTFSVAASGGRARRVPRFGEDTIFGTYSPDGRKLVVRRGYKGTRPPALVVADVNGRHQHELKATRFDGLIHSDWSVAP